MEIGKAVIASPLGPICFETKGDFLTSVSFVDASRPSSDPKTTFERSVAAQLDAYFTGKLKIFSLPLRLNGTAFQKRVWEALASLPFGETRTYQAISIQLKTSPRAVGGACRENPVPIVIPCHRVVAVRGLGGYSGGTTGWHFTAKTWLLKHESF